MKSLVFLLILGACSQAPLSAPEKKLPKANPFPRVDSGIRRICGVTQEADGYERRYIFDCREDYSPSSRISAGYGFRSRSGHPYTSGVRSPYPRGKVARSIDMISRNSALNETYLYVIDFAGGPDSHDPKTVLYLLPRIEIPRVNEAGNEIELTLPTGEKAFFDAHTGALKGGALREGPVDLRKDYRNRREPNVHYSGDYVSIRLTHSYEEPTIAAKSAIVRQQDKVCEVPRSSLFGRDGKLLTRSDEALIEVINSQCPVSFEL